MDVNSRLKGVDVSQNLEKLISAHQLLSYPSEHQSFNRAYEGALQSLKSSALVRELYIVQYRAENGDLCFGYISASSISANGPYHLTDICAVVRKPSVPRLVLQADCTTCGPVCEVERDARLVSQSALDHVERTGHVVVLNGTADIPE
jgi:hypothetical protein